LDWKFGLGEQVSNQILVMISPDFQEVENRREFQLQLPEGMKVDL
jgi:hypothetical protein